MSNAVPVKFSRRSFLSSGVCGLGAMAWPGLDRASALSSTLASIPITLAGDWGGMIPSSVLKVLDYARSACLTGVPLLSDRQPAALLVERRSSGPPQTLFHEGPQVTAHIMVFITDNDWSRLSYQFGHELGHVLANSWGQSAKTALPCQWLEESLAEAFSLRGLSQLARTWRQNPPFEGDNGFGGAITTYRDNIIAKYSEFQRQQTGNSGRQFRIANHRDALEQDLMLSAYGKAASLAFLPELERSPDAVAALGALNRWPERSALTLSGYLTEWHTSCRQLGANTRLPDRVGVLAGV